MEYTSFYGGRRGTPFVIVKSYPDIPTMCDYFGRGDDYKDVNYDQYVIIDTYKRDHPDNGKIFRRGYDIYSDRTIVCTVAIDPSQGTPIINGTKQIYLDKNTVYRLNVSYAARGAKYIGKISGPPGVAPVIKFLNYADALEKYDQQYDEDRKLKGDWKTAPIDLVPGDKNNSIKWVVSTISEENSEFNKVYAYIGFRIPYPVFRFTSNMVTQYDKNGNITTVIPDPVALSNLKDTPFFHAWQLNIPKGIKGDCLKNFQVVIPVASSEIYDLKYYLENHVKKIYDGMKDDILKERQILVYDEIIYDTKQAGVLTRFYVGDYNQISNISIDRQGTLIIQYTHNDPLICKKLIKWITNITLNKDIKGADKPGHFIIYYNNDNYNGTNKTEYDLDWVNNLILQDDGQIIQQFTGIRSPEYITDAKDDENKTIPENLNNIEATHLKWIKDVEVSPEGLLTVTFNDHIENIVPSQYIGQLRFPKQVYIQQISNTTVEEGTQTTAYTNRAEIDLQAYGETPSTSGEGTGTQKLRVLYTSFDTNGENDYELSQHPLNYIMKTHITEDKHLLVLYSDPEKRLNIIKEGKAYDFSIDDGQYVYEGYAGWEDLGSVSGQSGILVGKNYIYGQDIDLTPTTEDSYILPANSTITGTTVAATTANFPIDYINGETTYSYPYMTPQQVATIHAQDTSSEAVFVYQPYEQFYVIPKLKELYPYGLGMDKEGTPTTLTDGTPTTLYDMVVTNEKMVGKIITVTVDNSTIFYGFDYSYEGIDEYSLPNYKGWFNLGQIQAATVLVGPNSEQNREKFNNFGVGGLWFIVGDLEVPTTATFTTTFFQNFLENTP